jgi:zinc finger protein
VQRELALDAKCPACGAPNLVLRSMTQEMPYFGDTLHTVVECPRCDFKHSSSLILQQREPARHTLRFRAPQDLGVRVVRSHSGTYRIPELGFVAEPAEASESFVSNVEGVLDRVQEVLVRARLLFEEEDRRAAAEALLAKLQRIREGREEATLVLEDPFGNSGIHSPQAEVQKLSAEEAALLRTGVVFLEPGEV